MRDGRKHPVVLREELAYLVSTVRRTHHQDVDRSFYAGDCGCASCCRAIVDAIVSALIAEGWRNLRGVVADDEAATTGCLCGEPNIPARHCPVHQ